MHSQFYNFTNAIFQHVSAIISMPAIELSNKFEKLTLIPQELLVIDGTHIPVLAPKDGGVDFRNQKDGLHTIVSW